MKVIFLGVGEACDEKYPNTSIWLQTRTEGVRRSLLLDCGFTVPPQYWRQTPDPEDLDALWISHFHGDHFFGIPALLVRFWEMKRQKPLTLLGQSGVEDRVRDAMELAYPNFLQKLQFPLEFIAAEPEREILAVGLKWRFAENSHGQRDLAVRIEDGSCSVFYSGDGAPTPETLQLAQGCHLVIHEAFRMEGTTPGHGTVRDCLQFALQAHAATLALVHLQRDERSTRYDAIQELLNGTGGIHGLLPEPGDALEL